MRRLRDLKQFFMLGCNIFAKLRQIAQRLRMTLDSTDRALLQALQRDSQASAQDLSDSLHLSASQISRRRQRLEAEGIVQGYSARINAQATGLSVQAFVQVHLAVHGPQHAASFARLVNTTPAIVSAWTMTGDADYLLRVYCADLAALNRLIHDVLLPHDAVARVHSQIVMDQLKPDGPLPV